LARWLRITSEGLSMGKTGSPFSSLLDEQSFKIYFNNVLHSIFSAGWMQVARGNMDILTIRNSVDIGVATNMDFYVRPII